MLFKPLLALTLFASSALASSVLPRVPDSVNPPLSVVKQHQTEHNSRRTLTDPDAPAVQTTNAERMIVGLPPLPPRRRGSRTSNAARSAPSAGAPSSQGYIAARVAGTSTLLGYVKQTYNAFGENGLTSPSSPSVGALKVVLPAQDDRTGPFNIAPATSQNPQFPFLGFITGFANSGTMDLAAGSEHYLYFGGVQETAPYSTPLELSNSYTAATGTDQYVESAVWLYDDPTGRLTPQWINGDGSMPTIFYGYDSPDDVVIACGDKAKFEDNFGPSSVQWVDLYYVSA